MVFRRGVRWTVGVGSDMHDSNPVCTLESHNDFGFNLRVHSLREMDLNARVDVVIDG